MGYSVTKTGDVVTIVSNNPNYSDNIYGGVVVGKKRDNITITSHDHQVLDIHFGDFDTIDGVAAAGTVGGVIDQLDEIFEGLGVGGGGGDSLPAQTGNSGKFLTTDGSDASWEDVPAGDSLPVQTGNTGKFLTTDGTDASWDDVPVGDSLPVQTGNTGKFLATDGSAASWTTPLPVQTGNNGKFLTTDGSAASWDTPSGGVSAPVTLTDGATVTWDAGAGLTAKVTIAGSRTLAITNAVSGMFGTLFVKQGGSGSYSLGLPSNSAVIDDGVGAVSLSTDVGATDILTWVYDGTDFFWTYGKKFTKPTVYDTDAQAGFTATGITDVPTKTYINTYIIALKAYGIWAKTHAIYFLVGGTAAAHKFNWKNPVDSDAAFRLTFTGAWTHNAFGITGGSGKYANTHYKPATHGAQNNMHVSVYIKNNIDEAKYDIGVCNSGSPYLGLGIKTRDTNNMYGALNNSVTGLNNHGMASSVGQSIVTRDLSTYQRFAKNGGYITPSGGGNVASATPTNNDVYIGAMNEGGTANNNSTKTILQVSIGEALTSTECTNYYSAAFAFETNMGRL